MKIILYNNYSENNKLNKSIAKIVELQGVTMVVKTKKERGN